jgi:hypothetical protein
MENLQVYFTDPRIKKKIIKIAENENRSASNLVEFIIIDYLKKKRGNI